MQRIMDEEIAVDAKDVTTSGTHEDETGLIKIFQAAVAQGAV